MISTVVYGAGERIMQCLLMFSHLEKPTPWVEVHGGNDGNLLGSRYVRDIIDVTY
jgi:hypothetical protein